MRELEGKLWGAKEKLQWTFSIVAAAHGIAMAKSAPHPLVLHSRRTPRAGSVTHMSASYFTPKTIRFLTALTLNNNREWFEAHRDDYEGFVREPALRLIRDFAPVLKQFSSHLLAVDKKVGGSLMRGQRDTRFSRDKSPYKTNIGIQFRHKVGRDVHAPGLYLHVAPDACFLGSGVWHPDPEALGRIRTRIVEKPKAWFKVSTDSNFRKLFDLTGESLLRPPRGTDPDHPAISDLKRKDHIAIAPLTERDITSPRLLETVSARFSLTKSYFRFLCEALELPF